MNKKLIKKSVIAITVLTAFFVINKSVQAQALPFVSTAQAETTSTISLKERRNILNKVLDQSQTEAGDLEKRVRSIDTPKEWDGIKNTLVGEISGYKDYYKNTGEKLGDNKLTDEQVKNIAIDFKNWRETDYSSKLEGITNFILVFETNSLLNTVQNRLNKISGDIGKLDKQKIVKTDAIKDIFNQANTKFNNAVDLNNKAKDLLFKQLSPGKENSKTEIQALTTLTETEKQEEESVRNISKNSLKELKATYELFFQMNDLLKK